MKITVKDRTKSFLRLLYRQGVQLMAVSILSGFVVGVVISCFSVAAEYIAEYASGVYAGVRSHPEFIPLLFLSVILGAFMVGILQYLVPMIKGGGISQAEGASRGLLKLKWYQVVPAMIASSLFTMLFGLEIGAEGPGMFIGGMCSEGVSIMFRGSDMERRYQITAGASSGMAVVCNAPLTGIIFALEEAHRRFTPSIFICAFSSVITAILTKGMLFRAMRIEMTPLLAGFSISSPKPITFLYIAIAAIVTGLIGVAFFKLSMFFKSKFEKMEALKGTLRLVIVFIVGAIAGLVTLNAVGAGLPLINRLGGASSGYDVERIFSSPLAVTLVVIVILRLLCTSLNIGAGVSGGVFVPSLTIGACLGAVLSLALKKIGMSDESSSLIVLICISTFFATTVKAPLTAIVLSIELTGQYTSLLAVILGVAIGYMISQLFSTEPLYEALMEHIVEEQRVSKQNVSYRTVIEEGAPAAGCSIRDVLWPDGVVVVSITRDGEIILPHSDTVLQSGDSIVIEGVSEGIDELAHYMDEIVKPLSRMRRRKKNIALIKDKLHDIKLAHTHDASKANERENDSAQDNSSKQFNETLAESKAQDATKNEDGKEE